MKGWLALTLGRLAVIIGAVWTVQGLGYITGSVLTGRRVWTVIGPLVCLAGLVSLWFGLRARRHRC